MANNNVHDFAIKWLTRFKSSEIHKYLISDDTSFANECFELGFDMDCGKSLISAYPDQNVFDDYQVFQTIIDKINDIHILGSAIFSKWRYFNHWAYSSEKITLPENKQWFILALERLVKLSD